MTFVHPEFLYLMLPAIIILFFFLITGREEQYQHFSEEVLKRLQVTSNTLTHQARNALFFLMFVSLIVALAQPVIEDGKVKVRAKSADIMVALDISDSMLAQDIYPSRLDAAKQKLLDLLALEPQERIGVMAFAKDAYLVSPLSFDHRAVRFLIKQLSTGSITEKGTDFIGLLNSAAHSFKENDNRYLLILTDGGDSEEFSKEIALAKKEGIRIFVLGMGTPQGAPIKLSDGTFIKQNGNIIVSKLNSAVAKLATETGGAYIESVTSSRDIEAMLSEIAAKTKKRTLTEEEVPLYIPLFYYPLGLAMLLLIIATSSMSKRERLVMPHLFIAAILGLNATPSHAGITDFMTLDQARSSYEAGDYNQSAALYDAYAASHPSAQSRYNHANALYKQGNYAEAAKAYEEIHTADEALEFEALHNLGNSYAKQGDSASLKKALDAYEKALALKDEKPTRENYEAVKKALEEQQKQQDQQNDKQCDNPQENKNADKNKDQKPSDQEQQQQQDKKQNGDQGEQDQKQQQEDATPDQKDKNSANQQQKEQQQQSSGASSSDAAQPEPAEAEKPEQKSDESKQSEAAKSDEQKDQKEEKQQAMSAQEGEVNEQMSEREAQKWLQLLQQNPVGHLYRLENPSQPQERDSDEKPW